MDDITRARRLIDNQDFSLDYVRRLLIEGPYIYAKLENPGGSIILRGSDLAAPDQSPPYSTEIGSTFHLDLIELHQQMDEAIANKELTKRQVDAIHTWAQGMNSRDAAYYLHARGNASIQKLRQRAVRRLQERLDGKGTEPRGTSDGDAPSGRQSP